MIASEERKKVEKKFECFFFLSNRRSTDMIMIIDMLLLIILNCLNKLVKIIHIDRAWHVLYSDPEKIVIRSLAIHGFRIKTVHSSTAHSDPNSAKVVVLADHRKHAF